MSEIDKTVAILGAGYVGLTTAAIFANAGCIVYLIEPEPERLKTIQAGRSFFFEQGLDTLIAKGLQDKRFIPTDSYEEAIPHCSLIFSCVGTPDNPDGSSNLTYVFAAAESAATFMKPGSVFAQKSTVPVGTGKKVAEAITKKQKDFSYVSNPEFLREGTAVFDSLYFDRVVVGGDSNEANQRVLDIYAHVGTQRDDLAQLAGIDTSQINGISIETSLNGAELVKVTANAFLALKISFANSIAKLADQVGADVNEIMDAVGADQRIGRAFLNASRGYGGGCFPKDVSGLISSAEAYGVDLSLMVAATDVNESMAGYVANKARKALGGLEGKNIAILGLAFKAGTSDTRRSPGVKIANILSMNGAHVDVYDPEASGEAKEDLRRNVTVHASLEDAVTNTDAVLMATDWPEFLQYDLKKLAKLMRGTLLVDGMNAYTIPEVEKAGLRYIGVGR